MEPLLQQRQTSWFIFQNDSLLLLKKDNTLPGDIEPACMGQPFLRCFSLGRFNNIDYYTAEISQEISISDTLHARPLRQALSFFNNDDYGLVVKAYSVINWDKNHRFCSRCGLLTVQQPNAFERLCTSCGLSFFPRISPSIIVLIKRDDHLLMARSPHFPLGVYGLIAGFVDVGESLEEAVHREVKEEVGLKIKNLVYWGSQPWPFPDSLMLAFTADYASGEIVMDKDEIEDAGWYKYNNLPGLPSVSLSISMQLIEDFIRGF
jgi:NAD+ diphosphatase